MLKRVTLLIITISLIALVVLAITIACVVYRHCGRPAYKGERAQMRQKNMTILRDQYNAQPFTCVTDDQIKLSGYLIKRENAQRVILLCHGYNRSKEFMLPVVEMFPDDTIVLFDFRAHGQSTGSIVSFSINESVDIHAIIDYVCKEHGLAGIPFYGVGVSMGAASLVKAAYEGAPLKALVLDSSFAVFIEQLDRSWNSKTRLPKFFLKITRWFHEKLMGAPISLASPAHMMPQVSIPVCIIHADEDGLVPLCDAQALYDAAPGLKRILVLKSQYHARNFTESPREYKRFVDEFFDSATL